MGTGIYACVYVPASARVYVCMYVCVCLCVCERERERERERNKGASEKEVYCLRTDLNVGKYLPRRVCSLKRFSK